MHGSTRFGDAMDDEWFVVYLLYAISREFTDLVITVEDSDGDFLLFEAADHLPNWLTPATSANRIFIHNGQLHIIPMPRQVPELSSLPRIIADIESGIRIVTAPSIPTAASAAIQSAIQSKLSLFPSAIKSQKHRTRITVPHKVAHLIHRSPHLVADATHAFVTRDPLSMRCCHKMETFSPKQNSVTFTAVLTKTMYAQLVSQQFYPPALFHMPARSSPDYSSNDIGMKLVNPTTLDAAALEAAVAQQADVIKALKARKAAKDDVQPEVDRLLALKAELAKRLASQEDGNKFDRAALESVLARRFFITPSFQIYGGIAGLFDYGPPGCALQTNILALWRSHFVLEEDMLELECTNLTPEAVLKTSGHVDRFADYMVKDSKTGDIFRADHLVKQVLSQRLEDDRQLRLGIAPSDAKKAKGKPKGTVLDDKLREQYDLVLETLDNYQGDDLAKLIKDLDIRAPETGNEVTNPISPRQGLLRVREFTMAEIEHYVHPERKDHPRFNEVRNIEINLYSATAQLAAAGPTRMTIGEAVDKGIVNNQTLGYFVARIHLFLIRIGIDPKRLRFRQHLQNEMAHYACDCWDAEIQSSYGWIESVGCADRSAYDLTAHAKKTGEKLVARETLAEPIVRDALLLEINKAKFGPAFRQNAKA
eukprot:jgi/Hompol1/2777/HPOL_005768-RA